MHQKLSFLIALLFFGSVCFGTVDPNKEKLINSADQNELVENDSTEDQSVAEPLIEDSKPKEKAPEEEESESILSFNIIFEIISHFNLKNLLPSK